MGNKTWTTPAEKEFLMSFQPKWPRAQKQGCSMAFIDTVREEFMKAFPLGEPTTAEIEAADGDTAEAKLEAAKAAQLVNRASVGVLHSLPDHRGSLKSSS